MIFNLVGHIFKYMDQGLWPKIAISIWTELLHKKPSVCKFMHTKWHLVQPTKQHLQETLIQQSLG